MLSLLVVCTLGWSSLAQSIPQLEALLKKKPDNIVARVDLANAHNKEKNFDKVIELLNPYTDQLGDSGFLLLAGSYAQKKDFANEVRVLNILSQKNEDNYKWHMLLGQAYLKQANEVSGEERQRTLMTSGIQRLRRVLQLNPKFKPAFDLLLAVFMQQRANNEARELLLEGITKFGKRPELFRDLCRLDSQDGFLVQAVNYCTESIKLTPTFPDHYVFLVQALFDQKEDQRAEREIVNAGRKFPKSEFVQWAAGEFFLRKQNYSVATRYFQAAVAAMPNSARAQFGLAKALYEDNQEAQALDHFIQACKLDASTLETFLFNTGRLKQKAGSSDLAQKYVRGSNTCR